MNKTISTASLSGPNLKSKIANLKWGQFLAIAFIFAFGGAAAEAQQTGKVYRVGWLRFFPTPPTTPNHIAFRQGLRELGYVEGQNLVLEYRSAKGIDERRPEMALELVRRKVAVIVTSPAPPLIRAAKQASRTIPIVFTGLYVDPVEAGFVESLARPGGNITGTTNLESELHPKRLELLKEAFPRISHVAILWPEYQQKQAKKEVETTGKLLGIQIQSLVTSERPLREHIESVFAAISRENPDALIVVDPFLLNRHKARIMEFAATKRVPAIYTRSEFVETGGLMSYGADWVDLFRQTATYVAKILKGAEPGELPVERPRKFEFVINLKTANEIGLTIPESVLFRADKLIR